MPSPAGGLVQRETEKNPGAAKPKSFADVPAAQGDVAQAEKALQHAIELEPSLTPAYLMLAQVYVAANQHQQALDRLATLLARTNDVNSQVTALMQVGMIQEELKNFPAARDAYEKLLTVNPRFNPALNNLAYLYSERLGDNDKAYVIAEKGRQLQPSEPHTADTLGWILYKRGEYARALGLLDEAATALPAEPEVQFHLGMTHYMMGEEEPARLALQPAVESPRDFPGKEEAGRRLALLAMDAKTADAAARADLEKRFRDEPKDPIVAARLAAIYNRDGRQDLRNRLEIQSAERTGHAPARATVFPPERSAESLGVRQERPRAVARGCRHLPRLWPVALSTTGLQTGVKPDPGSGAQASQ